MIDDHLLAFVTEALPDPPGRVLEVGAGEGELAAALRDLGYDVLAIDPAGGGAFDPIGGGPAVEQVHLHEVEAPDASFDAAVAVLSLHHVEPLAESFDRLAALVRPGGLVVVDEFDVACFDERAAAWWIDQRELACGHEQEEPAVLVRKMRDHIHPLSLVRTHLQRAGFALGPVTRGPYLHRWHLPPGLRGAEEQLIAADRIPATGAQFSCERS